MAVTESMAIVVASVFWIYTTRVFHTHIYIFDIQDMIHTHIYIFSLHVLLIILFWLWNELSERLK